MLKLTLITLIQELKNVSTFKFLGSVKGLDYDLTENKS